MKRRKRNIDSHRMPIQLDIDFTYDYDPMEDVIRKIDTIVKKYLKLYDKAHDMWEELFSDNNTPERRWKSFRKYQRNLERAANSMIR